MKDYKTKGFICGTDCAYDPPEIISYTITYYYCNDWENELRKQKIRQNRLKKIKRILNDKD
jgi:hypothetical protein